MIASPEPWTTGIPLLWRTFTVPGCIPGSNSIFELSVEAWNGDGDTERGFAHCQGDTGDDVVAVPKAGARRGGRGRGRRRRPPVCRGPDVTLARKPDPLTIVDSRGNLDLERALLGDPPLAAALATRRARDASAAGAGRAGLRSDELAEDRVRDRLERPAPPHCRQLSRAVPGAAPDPLQVEQATAAGKGIVRTVPCAASRSSISTSARTSAPRPALAPPERPKMSSPKKAERVRKTRESVGT